MAKPYPLLMMVITAARAFFALAYARALLPATAPADVIRSNQRSAALARRSSASVSSRWAIARCDLVAFFIPRIAHRVPWRADCLVQALAGQYMLANDGIGSKIVIGTGKQPDGTFAAHAWLFRDDRVVLGGDLGPFVPLLDADGLLSNLGSGSTLDTISQDTSSV